MVYLYRDEFRKKHREYYKYDAFCKMWEKSFPHVKIRVYKNVCGHCHICSDLLESKKHANSEFQLTEIKYLHLLHRTAYMGERIKYYERQQQAIDHPDRFMSIVFGKLILCTYIINNLMNYYICYCLC